MDLLGIDIEQIVDLGTRIADSGAIRALDPVVDGVYDYTVALVALVRNGSGAV